MHAVWGGTVLSDGTIVEAMYFRRFIQFRFFSNTDDCIIWAGRYREGSFEVGGNGRDLFGRLPWDSTLVSGLACRFPVYGPKGERGIRRQHRGLDFPELFPVFQVLKADEVGNVWVFRYMLPWSEEPYVGDAFEWGGVRIAEVVIPFTGLASRLRVHNPDYPIHEIGADFVLYLEPGRVRGGENPRTADSPVADPQGRWSRSEPGSSTQ